MEEIIEEIAENEGRI